MNFYFDCGLPRSGSTLLTALLNQNPFIHAGTLSPVFELMYFSDKILHNEQAQAFPKPDVFRHIVRSQIINYYSDRDEPILINELDFSHLANDNYLLERYADIEPSELTFQEIENIRPRIYKKLS